MGTRTRLTLSVLALCLCASGALAAESAAFSSPADAKLVKETKVLIKAAGYTIPGILALPAKASAARAYPAVLMLHGSWSSKNEVGDMYLHLARALAAKGYASLRIDFEGSGDSTRSYRDLTYEGSVADAHAAFEWLLARPDILPSRVGVIGFSRGSFIGASLVGTEERVAAFASWSGALYNGIVDEASLAASEANGGHVVMDLGWTKIDVGSDYFTTMAAATPMDDFAAFAKPPPPDRRDRRRRGRPHGLAQGGERGEEHRRYAPHHPRSRPHLPCPRRRPEPRQLLHQAHRRLVRSETLNVRVDGRFVEPGRPPAGGNGRGRESAQFAPLAGKTRALSPMPLYGKWSRRI